MTQKQKLNKKILFTNRQNVILRRLLSYTVKSNRLKFEYHEFEPIYIKFIKSLLYFLASLRTSISRDQCSPPFTGRAAVSRSKLYAITITQVKRLADCIPITQEDLFCVVSRLEKYRMIGAVMAKSCWFHLSSLLKRCLSIDKKLTDSHGMHSKETIFTQYYG